MNENFDPVASMTLGEAIQRLRASEAEGDLTSRFAVELDQSFEQHDAVHVLFNLGTSIQDEIAVHIWMIFSTTASINEMHRAVADQEHRNVLDGIGRFNLMGIWLTCLPLIVGIMVKSACMKKRIAFENFSELKEQPVSEIRREHGIFI